jgi:hypothetical protein
MPVAAVARLKSRRRELRRDRPQRHSLRAQLAGQGNGALFSLQYFKVHAIIRNAETVRDAHFDVDQELDAD